MSLFTQSFAAATGMLADTFGECGVVDLLPREGAAIPCKALLYPEEKRMRQEGDEWKAVWEMIVKVAGCPELQVKAQWTVRVGDTVYRLEDVTKDGTEFTTLTLMRDAIRQIVANQHRAAQG